jgi:hypothetical protein
VGRVLLLLISNIIGYKSKDNDENKVRYVMCKSDEARELRFMCRNQTSKNRCILYRRQ